MTHMLDKYKEEKACLYKGEKYGVRDNGSVMRYPRDNERVRPSDNQWTFGKLSSKTGYMEIVGEGVHRIVATAFYGDSPGKEYVVDHIDTNRQNNRPSNLRWVTKFENIFLNPITRKKIEYACGCSIDEVLNDFSILQRANLTQEFTWMRAVSESEAKTSKERLLKWAESEKKPSGGAMGEWIFGGYQPTQFIPPIEDKIAATIDRSGTSQRVSHSRIGVSNNPPELPNYPAINEGVARLKTKRELLGAVQQLLTAEPCIMLPDLVLPTCGRGILIEKAHLKRFDNVEFTFEGRSRTTNRIIFKKGDYSLGVVVLIKGLDNKDVVESYNASGIDFIDVDLSWAKEGLSEEELIKILGLNSSKKNWRHNDSLGSIAEKLLKVCEPLYSTGRGVAHSYVICPLIEEPYNGRNGAAFDLECCYCDYRFVNDVQEGGCFGKSRINTYEELLSVVEVLKKEEQIVGITFNKNGEKIVKEFTFYDEETDALGKTLLELPGMKRKGIV